MTNAKMSKGFILGQRSARNLGVQFLCAWVSFVVGVGCHRSTEKVMGFGIF